MSTLSHAIHYTLSNMMESPIVHVADRDANGYNTVTMTWPNNHMFRFEVFVNTVPGGSVAFILDTSRTFAWGEEFLAKLYSAIDLYTSMPPLEDVCDCGNACAQGSKMCYTCVNGERSDAYAHT